MGGSYNAALERPRNAEIDRLEQRRLPIAVGKYGERIPGDIAIMIGPLNSVGDGAVPDHQLLRINQIVFRLVAFLKRAFPEFPLFL